MRASVVLSMIIGLGLGAGAAAAEPEDVQARIPVSWIDTKASLSAVVLHRGLVLAPLGSDHGGGKGTGALAAYDLRDPANPVTVFDSRSFPKQYHVRTSPDYLGDLSEYHHSIIVGDRMICAERRPNSAGFAIIDLAPLYDQDPATLPAVICRYTFPGVDRSTNYDGFSFALEWAGGRYVYAPTGSHGLFVIDTADLARPRLLTHLSNAQLANQTLRSAVACGDMLVVTPVAVGLSGATAVVFDISDPARPSLLSTFKVSIGYQGFLYGSRFYNVATQSHPARLMAWDLTDPRNITEEVLATSDVPFHSEYGYGKDGDLFLGHYPGLMRWSRQGGTWRLVDRVEPQHPPRDDYAFISPAGSLVAVTSDHNVQSHLSFAPLHVEDRTPPVLLHARPATGSTGVARTTGIGLAFSDALDTALLPRALVLRKSGGGAPVPVGISHLVGMVNLVPREPLDAESTYEVVADPAALRDQVGNPLQSDAVLLRFSTGNALTPFNVEVASTGPRPVGEEAELRVTEVAQGGIRLEHAWDFGDGSPTTAFGPARSIRHRFTTPGNHSVTVTSRRVGETRTLRTATVQVVHTPVASRRGWNSGSIAVDAGATTLWAVNPDHGTLAALDAATMARRYEVPVGARPAAVAVGADGRVWVTSSEEDRVTVLAGADGRALARIALPPGAEPQGILVVDDRVYVACAGVDAVLELAADDGRELRRVSVPDPRHLAWDPRRNRLVVPRFLMRGNGDTTVALIDRKSLAVLAQVGAVPSTTPDSGSDGRGSPNYLAAPALSPDLAQAWIPGKKDNLARGPRRDGKPLTFDHAVRSLGLCLDLEQRREDAAQRLDFDNSDFTTAAVFSPLGNLVFFASLGSHSIWVTDAYGDHDRFSIDAGGEAPIGLAMAPDGRTLWVHHLVSRSVAAIDISGLVSGDGLVGSIRTGATTAKEVLDPAVLAGKRLFHDSTDPALSQEGYMSCASCHWDGGQDGRVWDLSQFGEGLRNSIDLRGKPGQGPRHWTGNFDEVQDFNNQLRALNSGTGLLHEALLAVHGRAVERPNGEPKAGLSEPLDQLAAYVESLTRSPGNPAQTGKGLSAAAQRGRTHFIALDCMGCHRGPAFTDSAPGVRHDVGTQTAASGQRLGRDLDGLDTPTLLGLARSAPYLHDGSAATLDEVLTTRNQAQRHGRTARLSASERADLVAFLRELAPTDAPTPAEVAPRQTAPRFATAAFTATLAVEAQPGAALGRVQAQDADAGQTIRYHLEGADAGFLAVDPRTGDLTWQGVVPGRKGRYQATVVAVDDGRLPAETRLPVTVQVASATPEVTTRQEGKRTDLVVRWPTIGDSEARIEVGTPDGAWKGVGNQDQDPLRNPRSTWTGELGKLPPGTHVRVVLRDNALRPLLATPVALPGR